MCLSLDADTLLVGWGQEVRAAAEADLHPALPRFFLNDFFLRESRPWRQFSHYAHLPWKDLSLPPPLPDPLDWEMVGQEPFQESFYALQRAFAQMRWKKAVPYVIAESRTKAPVDFAERCLARAQFFAASRYFYAYSHEESGFLGLTPEILFTINANAPTLLSTMALAGTVKSAPQEDISHKLRKEHAWTVEGINQALSPFGRVSEGICSLLDLGQLQHLYTPIQLELNQNIDFAGLVRALHPTPALGVYPKDEGEAWLSEYDKKLPRHFFGAPIGCIDPISGRSVCYVAIRQVAWDDFGLRLFAGCGVTEESNLREEWEELLLKLRSIRSLFFSESTSC